MVGFYNHELFMVLKSLTSLLCSVGFDFPTHACGGTLDLLMTDVSDLVRVDDVAPIGNSDHSTLPAVSLEPLRRFHT